MMIIKLMNHQYGPLDMIIKEKLKDKKFNMQFF